MKKLTNTATQAKDDAMGFLLDAMAFGPSGAIERQELDGQRELASSDTLPTELQACYVGDERIQIKPILEGFGVKFIGPVEGDELFQYVELPTGWKRVPTDHSMWSDLVDEKGRKRAGIFYKAAFYDRKAALSLNTRFTVSRDYERKGEIVSRVKDGEKIVFETAPVPEAEKYTDEWSKQCSDAEASCRTWLDERYPNWRSPAAYWDEP
jgi:hypothetical protein